VECSESRRLIDEELDGRITPSEARALEQHLAGCPACRREHELLSAIDRALVESPPAPAPAGFGRSVIVEIARRVERRRRVESVVIPAACGTAAAAVGWGIQRLVNWEAARSLTDGAVRAVDEALAPLVRSLAEALNVATRLSQAPAAGGVVLALAVAAVLFLGLSAVWFARQFALERR